MPPARDRAPLAVLLPPISTPASSQRWLPVAMALFSERADLRPAFDQFAPASAAAFFGWVRSRSDSDQVYWCVDLGGPERPQIELLAAQGAQSWRSGPLIFDLAMDAPSLHPLRADDALERIECPPALGLHLEANAIHLVFAEGLRELRIEGERMSFGASRSWAELRRSPLDRLGMLTPSPDALVMDVRARRFQFSPCDGLWTLDGVALGAGAQPVPARAWCAWPGRDGEWLLLEADGRGLRRHRGPWRAVSLRRSVARRAEPIVLQRDPLSTALAAWRSAGASSVLAVRGVGDPAAQPLEPFRIRAEDAEGLRWRIGAPGLGPQSLGRALAAAWASAPDWLTDMRQLRVRSRGDELRLEFDEAVPDLVERLAHPALWLVDAELPNRDHRPGIQAWELGEEGALRLCASHSLDLPVDAARGDRVPVAMIPSPSCPPALRTALRDALTGQDIFGRSRPDWAPRTPLFARDVTSQAGRARPARGNLYLLMEAGVLPSGEGAELLERVEALLQQGGFVLQRVESLRSLRIQEGDAVARVARLPLHAGDPLLRAAELAAWLQIDAQIAPSLWRQQPGSPQRHAAAESFERRLLDEALVIPLWSLPLDLELPAGLAVGGLVPVGMPPLLWDLRRRGCTP